MKKPNMHIIIRSSGRDYVLIIFLQLSDSKTGLFEGNLFWVGQCNPPPHLTFKLEEVLIQY